MAQIIWKLPNGEIAITTLVEAADHAEEAGRLLEAGLIPAEWSIDHVRGDDDHFEIADPDFFPALTTRDFKIVVDMPKARALWRDRIRQARLPLFSQLDVAWQRADEAGDNSAKAAVAVQKQSLRDLTADPAIDRAKTVAALRATWPPTLP